MKKILLIDAHSSTLNYLHDCEKLGIEPIVMQIPHINAKRSCEVNYCIFGSKKPKIIVADDDYQKTLAMVKEINPILILPSCEDSLELSCRLSEDLGLKTNKWSDIQKIIDKFECQNMLKAVGLRHIEGAIVSSNDEIRDFFDKHGEKCVIKPITGTASVGVFVCQNKDELESSFFKINSLLKQPGREDTKFMVQEFTPGAEFVVNTCSCNGKHKVTSLFLYEKRIVPGFAPIYQRVIYLQKDDPLANVLIDYVLKVLDAVHVQHGPCHTELVVDAKGPVLIEVNVRIPGGTMSWQYLDKVLGHHETDVSLMSYLEPDKFLEKDRIFFNPIAYGIVKFIEIPWDMFVIRPTVKERLGHLPSYFGFNAVSVHPIENFKYKRTVDLVTSAGAVFLVNKDKEQLRRDLRFVNMSAKYHIEKLFLIDPYK